MPIQSYTTLLKMTQYCGVAVPKIILERIERVNKNDDEAVKRIGCEFAAVMCDQIYTKSNGDIDGVHFYTLNLERSVTDIVGMIEVTKLTKAPGELDESFSSTSSRRPDDEVRYDTVACTCRV
jgi:methylenetetrahydrofolate reductase (NADPH)